jgi:hypothetical protein
LRTLLVPRVVVRHGEVAAALGGVGQDVARALRLGLGLRA